MYNRFCRGDDPIPSSHAVSTLSLSLLQLLMRGFSCGPRWLQLPPAAGKAGRKEIWRQEVSWQCPALAWGTVGGSAPWRGLCRFTLCLAERHQGCASLAMTGGAGMAGELPCVIALLSTARLEQGQSQSLCG